MPMHWHAKSGMGQKRVGETDEERVWDETEHKGKEAGDGRRMTKGGRDQNSAPPCPRDFNDASPLAPPPVHPLQSASSYLLPCCYSVAQSASHTLAHSRILSCGLATSGHSDAYSPRVYFLGLLRGHSGTYPSVSRLPPSCHPLTCHLPALSARVPAFSPEPPPPPPSCTSATLLLSLAHMYPAFPCLVLSCLALAKYVHSLSYVPRTAAPPPFRTLRTALIR